MYTIKITMSGLFPSGYMIVKAIRLESAGKPSYRNYLLQNVSTTCDFIPNKMLQSLLDYKCSTVHELVTRDENDRLSYYWDLSRLQDTQTLTRKLRYDKDNQIFTVSILFMCGQCKIYMNYASAYHTNRLTGGKVSPPFTMTLNIYEDRRHIIENPRYLDYIISS